MSTAWLLDTNTVSYIVKGRSTGARGQLESLPGDDVVCVSAITEAEVRCGLAKRPAARALRAAIEGMLFKLRILPWGSREAAIYGDLKAQLDAEGISLSAFDMLIAAQAIAANAVLVSSDSAFLRVKQLGTVVNWASDV